MDNKFNAIESLLVNFIQSKTATLYHAGALQHVHEKLVDDIRQYRNDQLPACGVQSVGYSPEAHGLDSLPAVLEVVHRGGDVAAVDALVKEISSNLIDEIKAAAPRFTDSPISEDISQIEVESATLLPAFKDDSNLQFTVSMVIQINLGVADA